MTLLYVVERDFSINISPPSHDAVYCLLYSTITPFEPNTIPGIFSLTTLPS